VVEDPEAPDHALRFEIDPENSGARLDVLLSELAEVPRSQVQRWIEGGFVLVNDQPARASRKSGPGDVILATPPEIVDMAARPEDLPISILYQDADVVVVDKAAGMVVHPAPGHASGTLVNALLFHCDDLAGIGGVLRPGIVHRLDRGTSGVMVAAKNDVAHAALAQQFHEHTIERVYWAFVRALPGADSGSVDRAIGRHRRDRKRMTIRSDSGREARTHWRVAARYPASGISRLEVRLETGRTHQIRVHLSSQGMPIAGDPVYGRPRQERKFRALPAPVDRPALHAAVLGFVHPTSGETKRFEAPLPEDLHRFVAALEEQEARA
jgi:23S rRNA pseudouridine1911/1915/1917 synthase